VLRILSILMKFELPPFNYKAILPLRPYSRLWFILEVWRQCYRSDQARLREGVPRWASSPVVSLPTSEGRLQDVMAHFTLLLSRLLLMYSQFGLTFPHHGSLKLVNPRKRFRRSRCMHTWVMVLFGYQRAECLTFLTGRIVRRRRPDLSYVCNPV
jgi:hypothetical protein